MLPSELLDYPTGTNAHQSQPKQAKSPPALKPAGFSLLNFARPLLAIPLAGESFFRTALFPGFQVKRMPLDLFNDILLLYFTFEPSQSAFKRLAILQMDFCQLRIHHLPEP
jgi:hypothetical protein